MSGTTPPVFPPELIVEPSQTVPSQPTTSLGPLEHLVGTWTNKPLGSSGKGGQDSPFSYNVMPLPQVDPANSPDGYILKNFSYYEEITFSAIYGTAPNRGGLGTQVANTLFYEQRVYFADGPAKDSLVHAENGSWLFLTDTTQLLGPYGDNNGTGTGTQMVPGSKPPSQSYDIVKQLSVPHGNSILALGSSHSTSGVPSIPASNPVLPVGVNTAPYTVQSVGNPNPALTANPAQALINGLAVQPVSSYVSLEVNSQNSNHPISNIGFIEQHANVTGYLATYWLQAINGAADFTQLQYTQTILMDIPINGKMISFPHVTVNTLTKN